MTEYSLADIEVLTIKYPYSYYYKMLYLKALKRAGDVRYLSVLGDVAISAFNRRVLYEEIGKVEVKPQDTANDRIQTPVAGVYDIEAELANMPNLNPEAGSISSELEDSLNFLNQNGGRFSFSVPQQDDNEQNSLDTSNNNEDEENFTPQQIEPEIETFSETLAKLYVKQKKYDKAIKTFKGLMTRYPEKSTIFADQIRFLEKIIRNL